MNTEFALKTLISTKVIQGVHGNSWETMNDSAPVSIRVCRYSFIIHGYIKVEKKCFPLRVGWR